MRTLLTLASATFLLVPLAARADEQADLMKIIDKAIKAHGTDKAPKGKATAFKIKGMVHVMGMDLEFTGEYQTQEPDKFRSTQQVKVGDNDLEILTVVNDGKGWVNAAGNTQDLGKDAIDAVKEDFYAGKVAELKVLKDKGYKLAPIAEKKVGERAAVGVSVAHKGHKDIFLYFDKESGMLLMSERQAKDPMNGEEYKQNTRYSDYKDVDGVKRPHKVNIQRDGKSYVEAEVTEYKTVDEFDASVFEKP